MEIIDISVEYKSKLDAIFANELYLDKVPILKRGFAYPKKIFKNSVLFIGINPSYKEGTGHNSFFYETDYDNPSKNHRYFRKFFELGNSTNYSWSHLDLFAIRETSQSLVRGVIMNNDNQDFVTEHITLAKEIIEASTPKAIIVENTFARELLGKHGHSRFGFNFEFDNTIGTDRLIADESALNNTPVFFTSMLTGQRALDLGSFERLKWHIPFVLEKNGNHGKAV